MTNTRLAGHTLDSEGAAFDGRGRRVRDSRLGYGVCSCGDMSELLTSNNARKRWHRDHKAEIRGEAS
jgi:hypothetical protein